MRKLTFKEERRINFAIEDRVMNFSPTISPAPKNAEHREIESIREAILYYVSQGESKIVVQPKFMGNYCDIYLNRNLEKTRFFSRKSYPVPEFVNRDKMLEAIKPLWEKLNWDNVEIYLIQAEFLPWSAIGKGLIDREFRGYEICHQDHHNFIKQTGLSEAIANLYNDENYQTFLLDKQTLTKKELNSKYQDHVVKQYEALLTLQLPELTSYQKAIDVYHSQVELYGSEGDFQFKPFNILKIVYQDGNESYPSSNIENFQMVSNDHMFIIDCSNPDMIEEHINQAYRFFDYLVNDESMEGVIIKPDTVWKPEMVPMFKVRNNNYLQMIYGVRFLDDYDYYFDRRKISKKVRCSIEEWNITQTLLRIPMSNISKDNKEYVRLVMARILEEDLESALDTRL